MNPRCFSPGVQASGTARKPRANGRRGTEPSGSDVTILVVPHAQSPGCARPGLDRPPHRALHRVGPGTMLKPLEDEARRLLDRAHLHHGVLLRHGGDVPVPQSSATQGDSERTGRLPATG